MHAHATPAVTLRTLGHCLLNIRLTTHVYTAHTCMHMHVSQVLLEHLRSDPDHWDFCGELSGLPARWHISAAERSAWRGAQTRRHTAAFLVKTARLAAIRKCMVRAQCASHATPSLTPYCSLVRWRASWASCADCAGCTCLRAGSRCHGACWRQ